jgi:hypothetical protein
MRTLTFAAAAGMALAGLAVAAPASADIPPPSWTNERVLTCDDQQTQVVAYLTPAGFGSAFHVVDSTDRIVPVHVEVTFPGTTEPVTTVDVPGIAGSARETVECTYTDPVGLFIDFVGIRT